MLEDVDNWPQWTNPTSKTHMLSHKTLKREGNVVVCLEEEVAGGYRVKHTDKYTFYPKEKLVEEIIEGPISGTFVLTLKDESAGTRLDWTFDVKPETLRFKIIGVFKGKRVIQGIADEYCRQLAEYSETKEGSDIRKEQILA